MITERTDYGEHLDETGEVRCRMCRLVKQTKARRRANCPFCHRIKLILGVRR